MFKLDTDSRLTQWAELRTRVETSKTPFDEVCTFWNSAPYTPFNRRIDPYYQKSWPTPWEIISDNQYDDFTKSIMIAWTLRLTKRFRDAPIELRTYVDRNRTVVYNTVVIADQILNFSDSEVVGIAVVDANYLLENLIVFNFNV